MKRILAAGVRHGMKATEAASPPTQIGREWHPPGPCSSRAPAPPPTASQETTAQACSSAPTKIQQAHPDETHSPVSAGPKACVTSNFLASFFLCVLYLVIESPSCGLPGRKLRGTAGGRALIRGGSLKFRRQISKRKVKFRISIGISLKNDISIYYNFCNHHSCSIGYGFLTFYIGLSVELFKYPLKSHVVTPLLLSLSLSLIIFLFIFFPSSPFLLLPPPPLCIIVGVEIPKNRHHVFCRRGMRDVIVSNARRRQMGAIISFDSKQKKAMVIVIIVVVGPMTSSSPPCRAPPAFNPVDFRYHHLLPGRIRSEHAGVIAEGAGGGHEQIFVISLVQPHAG